MAITVSGTTLTFNNGSTQTAAGISAQNCSYTGSLVETAALNLNNTSPGTADLGSNRVGTGLRKYYDSCAGGTFLYLRGYNIKNTA